MSVILTDNFTGVDSTNLTAHTPDTGGAWSVQPGNGGGCAINSNRAYCTGATVMINSATPLSADYTVTEQVVVLSAINGLWGLVGRASNAAITMYGLALAVSSGVFSLQLSSWVNGSFVNVSNLPVTQPTLGTTHEIKLVMAGDQISGYYDGALIIGPVTNSSVTAAGFAGIHLGTSATTTGVHVDSIIAGDFTVVSAPVLTRIPNRNVGPMALRRNFRRTLTQAFEPPRIDTVLQPAGALLTLSPYGLFVQRDPSTGYLMLNGQRYRFGGNNGEMAGFTASTSTYGETVTGGNHVMNHAAIDDYFAAAGTAGMNARVARIQGLQWIGSTGTFMPTINTYDHAALEGFDYAITQCITNGIKIIACLVDNYQFAGKGKFDWCTMSSVTPDANAHEFFTNATVIANFKAFVSALLNHTNVYTGVKYKDDPVFLAWETGNELADATNVQSVLDWTADLAQYIKVTVGAQQLVMDGKWSILGPGNTVPDTHMNNPYIDIYTEHTYDQWRIPAHMANQATIAHNYGKAFVIGEYGLTGLNQSGSAIGWTNDDMIAGVEGNANVDGDLFWSLSPQGNSHGGGYLTHYPGDDAPMIGRVTAQKNHSIAMAGATLTNAAAPTKMKTLVGMDQGSRWAVRGAITTSGGQLTLPTGDTGLGSAVKYDLSKSDIVVELVTRNPGTGNSHCGMIVQPTSGAVGSDYIGFLTFGTNMLYRHFVGGTNSETSEAYNSSTHRWLRLRASADATVFLAYPAATGTIYWDVSSDGINWTNKRALTSPGLVLTSIYVNIFNWNWGGDGTSGTAVFDNFDDPPNVVTPAAATLTLTGSAALKVLGLRPAAAALTLTGSAPALALPTVFTPAAASLTLTGAAPKLDTVLRPTAASLTLTSSTPLIDSSLRPAAASLTLTGAAPKLDTVVRPTAASLTVTGAAPKLDTVLTPSAAMLALTGATPALNTPQTVSPTVASLTLTGAAPKLDTGLRPAVVALTLTGAALKLDTVIRPTAATLTLTGSTPLPDTGLRPASVSLTLVGSTPKLDTVLRPTGVVLTLTGSAPLSDAGLHPAAATLTLTGAAPLAGLVLRPPGATLALVSSIPTIVSPQLITPTAVVLELVGFQTSIPPSTIFTIPEASLTLTGAAPILIMPQTFTPTAASLTLTGAAPKLDTVVRPAAASLTLTGAAPTLTTVQTFTPTAASLTLFGSAPKLDAELRLAAAALTLTGAAPIIVGPQTFAPSAASLTLTAATPKLDTALIPAAASLTFTGAAPKLDTVIRPSAATLTLIGGTATPVVPQTVTPSAAVLTLTGQAPVVGGNQVFTPAPASLTLTSSAALLDMGVRPAPAVLTLTSSAPTLVLLEVIRPAAATLPLTGQSPLIIIPLFVIPAPTAFTLTGQTPQVLVLSVANPPDAERTGGVDDDGPRITVLADEGRSDQAGMRSRTAQQQGNSRTGIVNWERTT